MFNIIIYILLFLGVFFNLLGALGIIRFPDVYTRLHAGTKCTTFGSIYLVGSVVLLGFKQWYEGSPDGAEFFPPDGQKVIYELNYRDEELENLLEAGHTEADLKCTYLTSLQFHQPWPSSVDVDRNILTCEIGHFSNQHIVAACGGQTREGATVV